MYSSKIEPPDIRKLADMAQIAVTAQEAEDWQSKIEDIVSWFDQLQAVELEDQDEYLQDTLTENNNLRNDEPRAYDNREAIMEAMPRRQGQYLKVPKIL